MKKSIAAFFLVTSLSAFAATAPKSIAVLPFKGHGNLWTDATGQKMQDVFVTELRKRTKLKVLDVGNLNKLLEKNHVTLPDKVDAAQLTKIGTMLGVNYLLTGSVTEYGVKGRGQAVRGFCTISVSLIDTSTGEVCWADEAKATNVSVFGVGGGVDDNRFFQKVAVPAIQRLVASAKAKLR